MGPPTGPHPLRPRRDPPRAPRSLAPPARPPGTGSAGALSTLVATLALPHAFFRSYLKETDDERRRAEVLRTTLGLRLIVSLIALVAILAMSLPLASVLLG